MIALRSLLFDYYGLEKTLSLISYKMQLELDENAWLKARMIFNSFSTFLIHNIEESKIAINICCVSPLCEGLVRFSFRITLICCKITQTAKNDSIRLFIVKKFLKEIALKRWELLLLYLGTFLNICGFALLTMCGCLTKRVTVVHCIQYLLQFASNQ